MGSASAISIGFFYLLTAYVLFLMTVRANPGGVASIEAMNRIRGEVKATIRSSRRSSLIAGILLAAISGALAPALSMSATAPAAILLSMGFALMLIYWSSLMMVNAAPRIAAASAREQRAGALLAFRAAAVPGLLAVAAVLIATGALLELNLRWPAAHWKLHAGNSIAASSGIVLTLILLGGAARKKSTNTGLYGPAFAATLIFFVGVSAGECIITIRNFGLVGRYYLEGLGLVFAAAICANLGALVLARTALGPKRSVFVMHIAAALLFVGTAILRNEPWQAALPAVSGAVFSAASIPLRRLRHSLTTHLLCGLAAAGLVGVFYATHGFLYAFGEGIVAVLAYLALAPVTLAMHILAPTTEREDPFSAIGLGNELWYARPSRRD